MLEGEQEENENPHPAIDIDRIDSVDLKENNSVPRVPWDSVQGVKPFEPLVPG